MATKKAAGIINSSVKQVESNETKRQLTKLGVKCFVTAADHSQRVQLSENENVDYHKELLKAVEEIKNDIIDTSALPDTFDFGYALRAYLWSVAVMTSKTLGHRLARCRAVNACLTAFNNTVLSLVIYGTLPICVFLIPGKYTEKEAPLSVRRIILICLAFVFGLIGEHIWIHYIHLAVNTPSYYYPAVVGAMLQLIGPVFSKDRNALIGVCVTSALVFSLSLAAYMGELTSGYVISTCINVCASALNLQLLISDLRKNGTDEGSMVRGHYRGLIVNVYIHALLSLLFAQYDPDRFNDSDAALDS